MNWQPIETAPKDGTKIIAYWAKSGHCEDACLYISGTGKLYHNLFDGQELNDQPTHWMPMPVCDVVCCFCKSADGIVEIATSGTPMHRQCLHNAGLGALETSLFPM